MPPNNIFFHTEDISFALENENATSNWLVKLVESHNKKVGELNYVFCSDNYLLKLNQEHLKHDYFTDIITFDYCEKDLISGDLFISIDRTNENAKTFGKTQTNELNRVIAHGLLHLLGFKDKTAEEISEIRTMEEQALNMLISA
jgi:probable rRNA maturation factor